MDIELTNKDLDKIRKLDLHWIQVNPQDGVVEIFIDNNMLQNFRACEGHFVETFIKGVSGTGSIWFLDFGSCVHKMIEIYYLRRKEPDFNIVDWAGKTAVKVWTVMEMDKKYSQNENYINLGGCLGFSALLLEYSNLYHKDNERFRIVGAELYFGRDRAVPIHEDIFDLSLPKFRLYLSGKIDLLVDDGEAIVPMDHKTVKHFMGKDPLLSYEIQEGMTGYVYAARHLLLAHSDLFDSLLDKQGYNIKRKPANKIWMNFLQVKPEKKPEDRFRRRPLFKTDEQLEDYRLRQIRTASNILTLLLSLDEGAVPQYNTMMCNNWMHQPCTFFNVHRLGHSNHELIKSKDFKQGKIWNPEEVQEKDLELEKITC